MQNKHFFDINPNLNMYNSILKIVNIINIKDIYRKTFNDTLTSNIYSYNANTIEEYISLVLNVNLEKEEEIKKTTFINFLEFLYNVAIQIQEDYPIPYFEALFNSNNELKQINNFNQKLFKNIKYLLNNMDLKMYKLDSNLYISGKQQNTDYMKILNNLVNDEFYKIINNYQKTFLLDDLKQKNIQQKTYLASLNRLFEDFFTTFQKRYNKEEDATIYDNCSFLLNEFDIRHTIKDNEEHDKFMNNLLCEDCEKVYNYIYYNILIFILKYYNKYNTIFVNELLPKLKEITKKNNKKKTI